VVIRPAREADRATARYVSAWVLAAAIVLLVVVFVADRTVWGSVGLPAILLYIATVALAERVELHLTVQRAHAAFTLIEVAITAGLLLLPGPVVVLGTAIGTMLTQLARGLGGERAGFNAAIATLGSAVAAGVVAVFPMVGPLVGGRPVLGALAGMLLYAALNAGAMAGLVLRFAGADAWKELRRQAPFAAATIVGTASLGVVVADLWITEPPLVVFALAPAAAVHLAARGVRRTRELLDEVRVERDRLNLVVDGASDGILLLDRAGDIRVWSRAMEAMTGLGEADAVGRPVAEVLTPDVRRGEEPVRGAWLLDEPGGHRHRELEAALVHSDGTERVVRESHTLLLDEHGRAIGDVVVVRDVSRQVRLERMRADFIARVSHELRTPLTPIRGFAQTLRSRGDQLEPAQREDVLDRLVERTDHLGRLIDEILLITRFDADDLRELTDLQAVDLGPLVLDEVARFRELFPDRMSERDVVVGAAAVARADAGHVRRIVAALLDNAGRYACPPAAVRVEVAARDGRCVVAVEDEGTGIPADQRDAVFEAFHRVEDPLTMRTGGVGLGLFIGRRLAEVMHGELRLGTPERGRGTRMELWLPAAR
jgi:PAS domain S-box-containing protein